MNSKILGRPMFRKGRPIDVENVGIMDGFKDSMDDSLKKALMGEDDEGPEDKNEDEGPENENDDEENESGKMIGRTPRSPEILMNTLRGDMRSIPSRREELADLVGEKAAMNTPEEVLALLQSSLGQGIGGIPSAQSSAGAAPGGATPPPPTPPGAGAPLQSPQGGNPLAGLAGLGEQLQAAGVPAAPPAMGAAPPAMGAAGAPPLAPLNMASGGEVSYDRYYAEGGLAQKKSNPVTPNAVAAYPASAQTKLLKTLFQPPSAEEIGKTTKQFQTLFNEALGQNQAESERIRRSRMMAEVARSAFNFAANRGPEGAPLTGSFASRAAGAFGNLPVAYADLLAKEDEARRVTDVAALEQAIALHGKQRDLTAAFITSSAKAKEPKVYVEYGPDGKSKGLYTFDASGNLRDKNGEVVDVESLSGPLVTLGQKPPTPPAPRDVGNAVTAYNLSNNRTIGAVEDVTTGRLMSLDGSPLGQDWVKITSLQTGPEGLSNTSRNKLNDTIAQSGAATTNLLMTADQGIKLLKENPESVTQIAPKLSGLFLQIGNELQAVGINKKDENGNPLSIASFSSVKIPENLASKSDEFKNIVFQLALLELQTSPLSKGTVSNRDIQNSLDLVSGTVVDSESAIRSLERTKERAVRNAAITMLSAENRFSGQEDRVISGDEVNQKMNYILQGHYGSDYAFPQLSSPQAQIQNTDEEVMAAILSGMSPQDRNRFEGFSPEMKKMVIDRYRGRGNQ